MEATLVTPYDHYRVTRADAWLARSARPGVDDVTAATRTALSEAVGARGALVEQPVWSLANRAPVDIGQATLLHSSSSPDPLETLARMVLEGGLWAAEERESRGISAVGLSTEADREAGWHRFVCATTVSLGERLTRECDFQIVLDPRVLRRDSLGFLPEDLGASPLRSPALVRAAGDDPTLLPSDDARAAWARASRPYSEWLFPWHVALADWRAVHARPELVESIGRLWLATGSKIPIVGWLY